MVYHFENTKTNPLWIEQLLGLEIALQRMGNLVQEGLLLKKIQRMELGPGGGLQGY